MAYRPWFIVVLAWLVGFVPIGNILVFSLIYDQTLLEFMANLHHYKTGYELVCFYALPLVAAYSIYAVRTWSYPLFLVSFSLYVYQTYMTGSFPALVYDAGISSIGLLANLLVIGYFLLPTVRAAYFDPRVRWWEANYRYRVEMDATISVDGQQIDGRVSDISIGGLFIRAESPIDVASTLDVRFTYHATEFVLRGKVAHTERDAQDVATGGYGIAFDDLQPGNMYRRLRSFIQALELLETPRTPKRVDWRRDFWGWLMRLVTTGTGITPDLPARYLRKSV